MFGTSEANSRCSVLPRATDIGCIASIGASVVATGTSTPLYDPFLFVDSLTNRSIPVRNIRDRNHQMRTHRHSKTLEMGSQAENKQLDACIDFLKETMTFRKNALREKLFGDQKKEDLPSQEQELARKKRLIRQVVAQQIEAKSRSELEKYLRLPGHQIDQNLLKAARTNNYLLSKKAISKLVNSLQKPENHPMQVIHKKEEIEDPFAGRMDAIELEMKNQIREKLRKSGQFLVDPQYHFIQARSFVNSKFQQQFQAASEQRRVFLQQLKWQPTALKENIRVKKQVKPTTANKHDAEFISLVAGGDVQDVEIFAQKHRKQCLRAHDQKGNSLLHIAVINNKIQTFEWLLRKLGVVVLLEKNQQGMTAADLAVKLNRREILTYIPQSMI